jgi:hypothetical protein
MENSSLVIELNNGEATLKEKEKISRWQLFIRNNFKVVRLLKLSKVLELCLFRSFFAKASKHFHHTSVNIRLFDGLSVKLLILTN